VFPVGISWAMAARRPSALAVIAMRVVHPRKPGSRAGCWRVMDVLGHGVRATPAPPDEQSSACHCWLQMRCSAGAKFRRRDGGGRAMTGSTRRPNGIALRRTVAAIAEATGVRPVGWHTRSRQCLPRSAGGSDAGARCARSNRGRRVFCEASADYGPDGVISYTYEQVVATLKAGRANYSPKWPDLPGADGCQGQQGRQYLQFFDVPGRAKGTVSRCGDAWLGHPRRLEEQGRRLAIHHLGNVETADPANGRRARVQFRSLAAH
jgi:hypothetical protein